MHFVTTAYSAVQPNTTLAGTAVPGDSLTCLNDRTGHCNIIDWRAKNQVAGWHQLLANSLHDTTRNARLPVPIDEFDPLIPGGMAIQPTSQEVLQFTIAGSNVAGDVELGWYTTMYPNALGGQQGTYLDWESLIDNAEKYMTVFIALAGTGVATTGGWSNPVLIQAGTQLMKADRDYCLVGGRTDTNQACIGVRMPYNLNARFGFPGDAGDNDYTQEYYGRLSRSFRKPMMPIISTGDVGNTWVEVLRDENTIAVNVALCMYLLRPDWLARLKSNRGGK